MMFQISITLVVNLYFNKLRVEKLEDTFMEDILFKDLNSTLILILPLQ